MHEIWNFIKQLTDPQSIIGYGGLALLLAVLFSETGLLIGFFLPGDSLLFIAGMICSTQPALLGVNIVELIGLMALAAITGNVVGYIFGRRAGQSLFKRDDSVIFKKKYIQLTNDFYTRHGGKMLVLGRFLPIIRTFAPILAGVIKINFSTFMLYNILGAIAWVGSLTMLGYTLGGYIWVQKNIEYIVIFFIVITMVPFIRTYIAEKREKKIPPK